VTQPYVDAVVIGAGHNGLVTAAYLARAGLRVTVCEARAELGGTAGNEMFGGASVNLCNCDHLTFRTTPVIEELALGEHGLEYLDVEPGQLQRTWDDDRVWAVFHDVERTLDSLARTHPRAVKGYRRYVADAVPVARLILEAAASGPPSARTLARVVASQRGRGAARLLAWSRRSAEEVLREYFDDEALIAPAVTVGPVVWGLSPRLSGTGLGAITYALRHVARVGRPRGGSGAVPQALASVIVAHGGTIRLQSAVMSIVCDRHAVTGVRLTDGEIVHARIVVSAADPARTFLQWLTDPPISMEPVLARWRRRRHVEGYESKLDVIVDSALAYRQLGSLGELLEGTDPTGPTMVVAPSLDELHQGYLGLGAGVMMQRPALLANVPTALDATMAPPGTHVLSLEALYTPYRLPGGWPDSTEPQRWLRMFAELVEPDLMAHITAVRAVTPDRYERDFHLPSGHAASFAGGPLAALRHADPELTQYRTPLTGLYLTGAATFPGAGVWGASGRNTALTVLKDLPGV
jgi:phytoene dehydrogenase-like protein